MDLRLVRSYRGIVVADRIANHTAARGPKLDGVDDPPAPVSKRVAGAVAGVSHSSQDFLCTVVGRTVLHQPSRKIVSESVVVVPGKSSVLLGALRHRAQFVGSRIIAEDNLTTDGVRNRGDLQPLYPSVGAIRDRNQIAVRVLDLDWAVQGGLIVRKLLIENTCAIFVREDVCCRSELNK